MHYQKKKKGLLLCVNLILEMYLTVAWLTVSYFLTGNFEYRVTEESLMDRLTTNTRVACQSIHQNCRSVNAFHLLVPVLIVMPYDHIHFILTISLQNF